MRLENLPSMGGKEGQPAAICCVNIIKGTGKTLASTMAVRYRPRFPGFTSTPPRLTRPERLFREGAPGELGGSSQGGETRLQTPSPPAPAARVKVGVLSRPPAVQPPRPGSQAWI